MMRAVRIVMTATAALWVAIAVFGREKVQLAEKSTYNAQIGGKDGAGGVSAASEVNHTGIEARAYEQAETSRVTKVTAMDIEAAIECMLSEADGQMMLAALESVTNGVMAKEDKAGRMSGTSEIVVSDDMMINRTANARILVSNAVMIARAANMSSAESSEAFRCAVSTMTEAEARQAMLAFLTALSRIIASKHDAVGESGEMNVTAIKYDPSPKTDVLNVTASKHNPSSETDAVHDPGKWYKWNFASPGSRLWAIMVRAREAANRGEDITALHEEFARTLLNYVDDGGDELKTAY